MPTAQSSDGQVIDLTSSDTDPALVAAIRRVLRHGHTIDITTIGRRSGEPRRIEIMFHSFDGQLYISGMPSRRTRAWLHNLRANPRFTFHLKQLLKADLAATAREITDPAERHEVLTKVARVWRRDVESMERFSPLVEVTIPGFEGAEAAVAPAAQTTSGG
jgi:deazaflavin-dependent oxidoreductase (nitroreductase family)